MSPSYRETESGMHGSGAISHAYVQYPPFRCDLPGALGVTYDDGNRLLLVPTVGKVYSWSVGSDTPTKDPVTTLIKDGPVLGARFSLDCKVLAILRSNTEVEFVNRESNMSFRQPCKSSKDRILGLFWTDCPDCDMVFVTTSGLELYALQRVSLKLVERKRQDVSWFIYTHESRLVLLASGAQCKTLSGYQFSAGGIVKLPKFDASMPKADSIRKPILTSENVHIATMYGRLYCLQVDPVAKLLHMYRFYRDAVISQGHLPIYASNVSVSVVDNVLLIHQRDSKVVLLYDILADSKVPISAPLPLLIRRSPESLSSGKGFNGFDDGKALSPEEASPYGEDWVFVNPDVILDHSHGLLWKISLDLEAIAASSSDVPSLLSFLQRRRHEAAKAKQLCIHLLRSVIMEKRSLGLISSSLSVITTACGHAKRLVASLPVNTTTVYAAPPFPAVPLMLTPGVQPAAPSPGHDSAEDEAEGSSGSNGSLRYNGSDEDRVDDHKAGESSSSSSRTLAHVSSPVLLPIEMYQSVFAAVEEGMTVENSFLAVVVLEYMRCAAVENLVMPSELHVLLVELLAREQSYDKVYQLVADKVLEPSKPLALQLIKTGKHCKEARQLGIGMLKQVRADKEFITCLLHEHRILEALKHVRQNKLKVESSLFLEAASKQQNKQVLFSVLRFLCDFVPGFEQTQDYEMYSLAIKC